MKNLPKCAMVSNCPELRPNNALRLDPAIFKPGSYAIDYYRPVVMSPELKERMLSIVSTVLLSADRASLSTLSDPPIEVLYRIIMAGNFVWFSKADGSPDFARMSVHNIQSLTPIREMLGNPEVKEVKKRIRESWAE